MTFLVPNTRKRPNQQRHDSKGILEMNSLSSVCTTRSHVNMVKYRLIVKVSQIPPKLITLISE